jgi:hypothetical protein
LTSQTLGSWEIYHDTDITSGNYGLIDIYDTEPNHTTVNFYGDLADYIGTHDSSTLNFFGGHAEIEAWDSSIVNVTGGTLNHARANNYGTVNFYSNAYSTSIGAFDYGITNMYGGIVEDIGATGSGTVNLYAGYVLERLYASGSSIINIYGHDLFKTSTGGAYGYGEVYGYLTDDTYISVNLNNIEAYLHINLIEVVDVEVQIRPEALNPTSGGQWITCEVFIPEDYNVADVNSSTVYLEHQALPEWIWFNEKQNVVMAKFNRSKLSSILEEGNVELTVSCHLLDGTYFLGADTIKVINKARKDN